MKPSISSLALLVAALLPATLAAAQNQPPVISPLDIYRTYPELPIQITLAVNDPNGDGFDLEATDIPSGGSFEPSTGVFTWTPGPDQAGLYEVIFIATDDGAPPESSEAVLNLQVSAADACFELTCDPATGCQETLPPIESACCYEEPTERIPEPDVGCPEGRALIIGRNDVGFGQLHNCDWLETHRQPQGGGTTVTFHVAARCVNSAEPVSIRILMEAYVEASASGVVEVVRLIDPDSPAGQMEDQDLVDSGAGFAQKRAIIKRLSGVSLANLVDLETQLTVSITDADGVMVEDTVRLTLTDDELADIPEPDDPDVIPEEAGCVGCHRPLDESGSARVGIEDAHPWGDVPLTCTDCHGGNGTASSKSTAHVLPPPGDSELPVRGRASDELDALPVDYLRFLNPGDLRAAGLTCGQSGCHPEHVANLPYSTMATYVGHYTLPRFLAGTQDRTPIYAAVDIHKDYGGSPPVGTIEHLEALREPDPEADRSEIGTAVDIYLPKACPTCHLSSFGPNNGEGKYRSSGCTACHMLYDDDGLSLSEDPTIALTSRRFSPPHPVKHQLTAAIPTEQCAHCHFQGGRVGLSYQGIREGGFSEDKTPPHATPLGRSIYGHQDGFYFVDEDDTNEEDETPPDLHFDAGMVCADCHVGGDVHGDGNLYASERHQVGIRCEDCHGTVRAVIEKIDGSFRNSKGDALRRLQRDDTTGVVRLTTLMTGEALYVPQIKTLLDFDVNQEMTEAMGVKPNGFSHTDTLECYACHTAWQPTCFGCHVTVDDSLTGFNQTTGETTPGGISGVRDDYEVDAFTLGINTRGKLSPLCNSMSLLMTYVDEHGETVYEDKLRTTTEGTKGFGWNPFHFHTVSKKPKTCDRCHAVDGIPSNLQTLKRTYGFGDGTKLVQDGDGVTHDLTQLLDAEGELISTFPHAGTGPVPADIRERAMAIRIPEPLADWLRVAALATIGGIVRRRSRRR